MTKNLYELLPHIGRFKLNHELYTVLLVDQEAELVYTIKDQSLYTNTPEYHKFTYKELINIPQTDLYVLMPVASYNQNKGEL